MQDRTSFAALSFLFVPISKSNCEPFSVRFLLRHCDRSSHSSVSTWLFLHCQHVYLRMFFQNFFDIFYFIGIHCLISVHTQVMRIFCQFEFLMFAKPSLLTVMVSLKPEWKCRFPGWYTCNRYKPPDQCRIINSFFIPILLALGRPYTEAVNWNHYIKKTPKYRCVHSLEIIKIMQCQPM